MSGKYVGKTTSYTNTNRLFYHVLAHSRYFLHPQNMPNSNQTESITGTWYYVQKQTTNKTRAFSAGRQNSAPFPAFQASLLFPDHKTPYPGVPLTSFYPKTVTVTATQKDKKKKRVRCIIRSTKQPPRYEVHLSLLQWYSVTIFKTTSGIYRQFWWSYLGFGLGFLLLLNNDPIRYFKYFRLVVTKAHFYLALSTRKFETRGPRSGYTTEHCTTADRRPHSQVSVDAILAP